MSPHPGPAATPKKSTNVRSGVAAGLPAPLRVLRGVFPLLPSNVAGALADWVFFTPWRATKAFRYPEGGHRFAIDSRGVRVEGRRWGHGPRVFLVHGWEGSGAQMGPFVEPLVEAGYEVIAWDAPGHGDSGGFRSSMVAMADAATDVAKTFGAPHAVIAHSLGGAATLFAVSRGLHVDRLVLVGTPSRPITWADSMARLLGLGEEAMACLRSRTEARIGVRWSELDVPDFAQGLPVPTLVVHDANDREVSPLDADDLSATLPNACVVKTVGLGHRRVLREAGVLDAARSFVGQGAAAAPWTAASLEELLYVPALRWAA